MTNENTKLKQPLVNVKRFPIEVSIWRHENNDRPADYTVTHSRSYKKGDQWFNVSSYRQEHLMILAKLLSEADSLIEASKELDRKSNLNKLVRHGNDVASELKHDQLVAKGDA